MIDKKNVEDVLSLTAMQEGMLFHYLKDPAGGQYFEQICFDISAQINITLFQRAWEFVVESHEMLRTIFRWEKLQTPVQIILKEHKTFFKYQDLTDRSEDIDQLVREIKDADKSSVFNLSDVPFRVSLFKIKEGRYVFLISNHHILYDGWSNGIIIKDFFNAYENLCIGKVNAQQQKGKYREFINKLRNVDKATLTGFWKDYLKGFDAVSALPFSRDVKSNKPVIQAHRVVLSANASNSIHSFVSRNKVTLASVMYTSWALLMSGCTNTQDIVFGIIVSGRNHRINGIENIVGLFINAIPIRITFSGDESIGDILNKTNNTLQVLKEYESISITDAKQCCHLKDGENLFNSLLIVENYPLDKSLENLNSLTINNYSSDEITSYDLTITITCLEEIKVEFKYNAELFDAYDVKRIGEYFSMVLLALIDKDQNEKISALEILDDTEKRRLLFEFNNTTVDYQRDATIVKLFEEQVNRTPNAIALVFEERAFTYNELNERANRIAGYLQKRYEVGVDDLIGIQLQRSEWLIGVLLAILKTGAGYVPIDPAYPQERIDYMISDSRCKVVIDEKELINIKQEENEYAAGNLNVKIDANNLAYVIYTSGSTGKPKGVMVEHRAVVNFIESMRSRISYSPLDTMLCLTSISFDIFVLESWLPLTSGIKIVLVQNQTDTQKIADAIELNKVSLMQLTPSKLQMMLSAAIPFNLFKYILIGGEAFPNDLLHKLRERYHGNIYNMYGPTETTVWSAMRDLTNAAVVDIGSPINNTYIYIVNKYLLLQPVGVAGEICIGGEGIARGYLNNEQLTAEKFVSNPFRLGERMYRTGDIGRWLPDGNIEYLGRKDEQVKLRGYRIELGEIESQLQKHPQIKNAVVIARGEGADKVLCAYYVATQEDLSSASLRSYLSTRLPDYMIPTSFMQLESIPLTPNGKVNRQALPVPVQEIAAYCGPRNETEVALVDIWSAVLATEAASISIDSNFFSIGGHSLRAMTVVSKIHKLLGVKLPVSALFDQPTISRLSGVIDTTTPQRYGGIKKAAVQPWYRLSSGQKRLYILQQLDPQSVGYNMGVMISLGKGFNHSKVALVFEQLIQRHESLRTCFELLEGEPVQRIWTEVPLQVTLIEQQDSTLEQIQASFIRPFDLSQAPLLRVCYVHGAGGDDVLLVDMHHIISDGRSEQVLEREFWQLYNGEVLSESPIQYKDYSEWLQTPERQAEISKQLLYWQQVLSGELPVLGLPYDYPRPSIYSFEGASVQLRLTEKECHTLHSLCRQEGVTLYMCLLSVVTIWLSKLSGQEDILIGSPVSGRSHEEMEDVVGMFVNTLVMRNYAGTEKMFSDFLQEVKQGAVSAYANQGYGFEELVEKLSVSRDRSRNPLFDVLFVLQSAGEHTVWYNRDKPVQDRHINGQSKFDMTIQAEEREGSIVLRIEYCRALFTAATIDRFIGYLRNLITALGVNPLRTIGALPMLDDKEVHQLLQTFNDTAVAYDRDCTIVGLFEEQVKRFPDKVGLLFGEHSFTYRQLNERANQLADYLRKHYRVEPDELIGIQLERSEWLVISMLGILKSGAAYVPIDPLYPRDRIDYMIADSRCKVVIDEQELNHFKQEEQHYCKDDLGIVIQPSSLAYVMYTSGSTGLPKGVMIEHKSVHAFIHWCAAEFSRADYSVVFATTSICFDLSVFELFYPLSCGAKIRLLADAQRLADYLATEEKILLNTVPTVVGSLLAGETNLENVRVLNMAGEPIPVGYIDKLDVSAREIRNLYGPSEDTTYSTCYRITQEGKVLIGRPIWNTQIYILGAAAQLVPVGVAGEIYIGGEGIARGYLNNEQLTAEKFVSNPFRPSERMYRTGDIGRWLPDGNIEYLGRKDEQVKLRGYRIELGEIESQLQKHPQIKNAVVIARGEGADKVLCAYYVATQEDLSSASLRRYLSTRLPDYMIPTSFMQLESIPLTPNGKVNRQALPVPAQEIAAYCGPRNETEVALVDIWSAVLAIEAASISIDSNFFSIGGHSLRAMTVVSKIHKLLGVKLPVSQMFEMNSIRVMSEYIMALNVVYQKAENRKAVNIVKI